MRTKLVLVSAALSGLALLFLGWFSCRHISRIWPESAELEPDSGIVAAMALDERDSVRLALSADALTKSANRVRRDMALIGAATLLVIMLMTWLFSDRLIATLEKRVQERTRELERAHASMAQAEKMAAVGQLAGGIAHDFNNILTGILGSVELVRFRDDLPSDVKPDLESIQKLSKRAAALVRQILDFSRKSMVEMRPLDMAAVVAESMGMLRHTISEKIKMTAVQETGKYTVVGDSVGLQRALANMAVNSQEAIEGDGEISFRLARLELKPEAAPPCSGMNPGSWVVLTVADTGSGIPAEAMPHVFEPFFTTKGAGRGTGLGLAQVFGIVKRMQGFIHVDSWPGAGTAIAIYLPAADSREPAAEQEREAARACRPVSGRPHAILLVEDEESVRKIARRLLESLGYQVRAADSGAAALALFDSYKNEISLVLTDMTMPGVSGLALIKELQARSPGIKSIVMSGYPFKEISEQPAEAGGAKPSAWISKPLEISALSKLLADILGSRPSI